jgi:hypothetical protein
MTTKIDHIKVLLINQTIFGGWFCIDKDLPEDEALTQIVDILQNGNTILEMPVQDKELVRDRLFGGFRCAEDNNRRHIYFALGNYTFCHPEMNRAHTQQDRDEDWTDLWNHSKPEDFIAGGPFCEKELMP